MCARTRNNENRVLTISALLASGFAGGGLVVGMLVGSLVIVFDGVYSLVSLLLTLLSLVASRYIRKPSDSQFPLGRAVFEPAVIAIKASVILLVVSYSLYSAVVALFTGGREVDASIATLFGAINVIGCGFAWWFIAQKSKRYSSGLIEAETKQWQMDTLLSVVVTVGFLVAFLVTMSPYAEYAVYVDPMMMLLMSFYFIKVPYDMLKSAMRELLMMSASKEICNTVDQGVIAAGEESDQEIELTSVTKVGHELWVNVDIRPEENEMIAIEDIESTRRSLHKRLSKLPFELQLNMNIAR
ncbi:MULTISPECIES: cation diffusion facilitator family transporter [Vibrio]|uniref:Cation diffusion facilitator family transporter n=1 Tax=Vibrio aestuarianus TaxID=28171 RepID=A0AAX3U9E1_9VIBR|nr:MULTISPECIES: cation diffusion facilitator family transporter [Vibrio]KOE82098.1 cobalt-zinc-cadmium resistance protein [Vibrio alginolyticus]MDE1211026.1 cation diffusion facilitator family transporter [Vibrio aestuarianus]MDE1213494.1 cation diffusion facilitator family transporter [Vibrio aestuarianus]MDE1219154.1 cation diffusion facilitator family transporter [Vibrio aestuarianus]MDE1222293.1 cation diffusion facilitator family transporter [Vibrio aestuarianus]